MKSLVQRARHAGLAALLLVLTACGTAATEPAAQPDDAAAQPRAARPLVIATTTQLEDVVGVIAGEYATVVGLVPRNGDPHEFEPTPEDVKSIADSQAVFKNGAGLEGWLDKLIENAGDQRPIIDTSHGIALDVIDRSFEEGGETDPHIWMSPLLMQTVTDNIAAGLAQIDPPNAAAYQANASEYKTQLAELDTWAADELAAVPAQRRKLVTAHDTMGYFASRYDFTIVGTVIPSVSTEAAETSAKDLAALIDTIRATGVPTIFAETTSNPAFIEQIAAETNVQVDTLYSDSLGDKGGEAGTYLDYFRTNVTKIAAGLR